MKIKNRTFIISGGSSGLGLVTAQNLLEADAYIAILDISPVPEGAFSSPTLAGASASAGEGSSSHTSSPRWTHVKVDVRDLSQLEAGVERVMQWTRETGAELGGVICSAGLARSEFLVNSQGQLHSTETWNSTMDVNVSGSFHLTGLVVKHLMKVTPEDTPDGERGVVILISSEAAYNGQPGVSAYAASKGALGTMTLPLARELARHHIRVVSIAPGLFDTPLPTTHLPKKVQSAVSKKAFLYPNRLGAPTEFAKTVRWVLDCAYVNGDTIRLTGGGRMPAFL